MKLWTLLKDAALALIAVFAPVEKMMIVTLILVLSDLILGLIAAYKRKEPITSAGLRRTVTKIFVYEVAIMIGFLAEHYLTGSIPVTKLVGAMISITEVKSILENLNGISGQNLLQSVLNSLNSQNNNNQPPSGGP